MEYLVAKFKFIRLSGADNECGQTDQEWEERQQVAADLLCDMAGEAGFESFENTTDGVDGYVQVELFDKELLDTLLADWPVEGIGVSYETEKVKNQDWNSVWEEEGFERINIDDQIVIYDARRPSELEEFAPPARISIGIEATNAFGTGTHETTQMVVKALTTLPLEGKRLLDCGCGTGILGIAASKLGAADVVGYDIDEWSVDNTRHNAELNNVSNIDVLQGDATVLTHVSGIFDVIVANINRNIIIQDLPHWVTLLNEKGIMILSGFLLQDKAMVAECAAQSGLKVSATYTDNDWCCLVLES